VGREVRCKCRWNSDAGEVKALLESHEIILRGHLRAHIPLSEVTEVRVDQEGLRFKVGGDQVILELAASEAVQWARRMTRPPATLRDKLGISATAKAFVLGRVKDSVLKDALRDAHTRVPADARIVVAVVQDESGLATAAKAYAALPPKSSLWIIHAKGPEAVFGERRVRESMRSRGFVDTKTVAVSSTLTAARFVKKS
jgi:hypothetical protein